MTIYSKDGIDYLNHEYSPSQHTKRYKTADEAIQGHIKLIEKETYKVRNECGFLIDFDIKYGTDDDEVLDIYSKDTTAKDAPLFIYIHGGYWQMLTKDTSAFCVEQLVNAGYRVMIVNYSLCPKVPLTHLIRQIQDCIKFCLTYASKNNSKLVSFCGHSAGAHLCLSALSNVQFWKSLDTAMQTKLKQVYLVSGVYDLREIRYLSSVNNNNILGLNDQNTEKVSPIFNNYSHLTEIEFNVFVGEYDSKTFQKHSKDISDRLIRDINVTACTYQVFKDIDHFSIVENLRLADYCITKKILQDGGLF